jgi:quinol-cytochrome oxidoreductase complex cytochrome b subunit
MTKKENPNESTIPFYPDHVMTEVRVAWLVVFIVLIVGLVGVFLPVGLEPPADPMVTPQGIKPEWYFLAIYQVIKFLPKVVGALLPFIIIGILFVVPFIDRKPDTSEKQARYRLIGVIVFLIVFIILTIWGGMS